MNYDTMLDIFISMFFGISVSNAIGFKNTLALMATIIFVFHLVIRTWGIN